MSYRKVTATFTRPSNTTQYAVGDVLTAGTAAAMTFTNVVGGANGNGEIVKSVLVDSANQATLGDFELWLFHTAPTMDNDNAAFTPTDAEMLNLVGIIDFPATVAAVGDATSGAGGNVVYLGVPLSGLKTEPIGTKIGSRTLYGVLVARSTYTPVSAEEFTITLWTTR